MVDMTVGGLRFYKSFDVIQMAKRIINQWNEEHGHQYAHLGNDYSNLMDDSYPEDEDGRSTGGRAKKKTAMFLYREALTRLPLIGPCCIPSKRH